MNQQSGIIKLLLTSSMIVIFVFWQGVDHATGRSLDSGNAVVLGGESECDIDPDDVRIELTQAVQRDPRDSPDSGDGNEDAILIKNRRMTLRVYAAGDCGPQATVNADLRIYDSNSNLIYGPKSSINGSVKIPWLITHVNRDEWNDSLSPLSYQPWPWSSTSDSSLEFEFTFTNATTSVGNPVVVSEVFQFEEMEQPYILGVPIDNQAPDAGAYRGIPSSSQYQKNDVELMIWDIYPFPETCGDAVKQTCGIHYRVGAPFEIRTKFSTHLTEIPGGLRPLGEHLYRTVPYVDYGYGWLKGHYMYDAGASIAPQSRITQQINSPRVAVGMGFNSATLYRSLFAHEAGHGIGGICHGSGSIGDVGIDYFDDAKYGDGPYVEPDSQTAIMDGSGGNNMSTAWARVFEYNLMHKNFRKLAYCNKDAYPNTSMTSEPTPTLTPSVTPTPTSIFVVTSIPPIPPPYPTWVTESDQVIVDVGNVITGSLSMDRAKRIGTTHRASVPLTSSENRMIRYFDASGSTLSEYGLSEIISYHGIANDTQLLLPWDENIQRISLLDNGMVVDTITRSLATPVITVTSPIANSALTETLQLAWTASDADGEGLVFDVDLIINDDERIFPIVTNSLSTTLTVDMSPFQNSGDIGVRITAHDSSLNRTSVIVDDLSLSLQRSPSITIISPKDSSVIQQTSAFAFMVAVDDPDESEIPFSWISWTSSIDGALGTGPIVQQQLSKGVHLIEAKITDSSNLTATDQITVTVK